MDVVMLMTPTGLLAGKRFAIAVALSDLTFAGVDLAIATHEEEIVKSMDPKKGRDFISGWNSFVEYYFAARILTPILYKNAVRLHNKMQAMKPSEVPSGFKEKYETVKEELESVLGKAPVATLEEWRL